MTNKSNDLRIDVDSPTYTPEKFIDVVMERLNVKTQFALSEIIDIAPSTVSRVVSKKIAVSPYLMIRVMDATNMTIKEIRDLLGAPVVTMGLSAPRSEVG